MRPPLIPSPILAAALSVAPCLAQSQSQPALPSTTTGGKPASVAHPATPSKKAAPPKKTAAHPAAPPSREGIESLEVRLDAAADRVSAPQMLSLLGRPGTARGYRLPGYGIVVVLTPRALPASDVFKVMRPRHRVRVDSGPPGGAAEWVEAPELDALERQVVILQHETEAARRAAEETQQRIVETVRYRFGAPGEVTVELGPEAPAHAELPEPPTPPAPETAPAPAVPAVAGAPLTPPPAPKAPPAAEAPVVPEAPAAPPPPWKFWFSEGPRDERTKDAVVADVRAALVDAMASHPGHVVGLGPEEFVAVVVDFEDAGRIARRPRPERTLVVRARVRDMEARSAGAITPEELRRRLEVLEY